MTQPLLLATLDSDMAPVTEDAVIASEARALNSSELGDISEMKFEIEACARGWTVASPRGRARDFDCIVKRQTTRPITIQIKKARKVNDFHYVFNTARHLGKSGRGVAYSLSAFDVLAAHLWDVDKWVFYSRQEIGDRHGMGYTLPENRVRLLRNPRRAPNNWHLLDEVAESLTPTQ